MGDFAKMWGGTLRSHMVFWPVEALNAIIRMGPWQLLSKYGYLENSSWFMSSPIIKQYGPVSGNWTSDLGTPETCYRTKLCMLGSATSCN